MEAKEERQIQSILDVRKINIMKSPKKKAGHQMWILSLT